jgi:predicted dehydrogenase
MRSSSHATTSICYALAALGAPEWCTAALANGKHVLVEKPFANNAEDAAQMVRRALWPNLFEGFHYRFIRCWAGARGAAAAPSAGSATSRRCSM